MHIFDSTLENCWSHEKWWSHTQKIYIKILKKVLSWVITMQSFLDLAYAVQKLVMEVPKGIRVQKSTWGIRSRKPSSSKQSETTESINLSLQWENSNEFNWKTHCLFCGKYSITEKKHLDRTKKLDKDTIQTLGLKTIGKESWRKEHCQKDVMAAMRVIRLLTL